MSGKSGCGTPGHSPFCGGPNPSNKGGSSGKGGGGKSGGGSKGGGATKGGGGHQSSHTGGTGRPSIR